MHQVEALVDLVERQAVGNHRVALDHAVHVPVDDPGRVGPAARAAERGAAPVAARHQLERARRDLLARLGYADDDRRAPAAVAAFERGAHHLGIAGRIEAVVGAAIGECHDPGDGLVAAQPLGIEEVGHAEAAAPVLAIRIDVDADDHLGTGKLRALDDVEADAAEAEDDDILAGLDLGGVDDLTDAPRHAAADVAARVERRVGADLRHRDLREHGEVREGLAAQWKIG